MASTDVATTSSTRPRWVHGHAFYEIRFSFDRIRTRVAAKAKEIQIGIARSLGWAFVQVAWMTSCGPLL